MIQFTVPGIPAPKGSRIPGRRKDGTIYTRPASKNEKPWAEAIAHVARGAGWLPAPYSVRIEFTFPRPKRPKYAWPSTIDVDKAARLAVDAIVTAGCIDDDRHVTELHVCKRFGDEPGARVWIETADATQQEGHK